MPPKQFEVLENLRRARGMSMREITGHLRELYGIEMSADLISTVTDAVIERVTP